jgi:hypothetical protein
MDKILLYGEMETGETSESTAPFLPGGGSRDRTSPKVGGRKGDGRRGRLANSAAPPGRQETSFRPENVLLEFFDYQSGELRKEKCLLQLLFCSLSLS